MDKSIYLKKTITTFLEEPYPFYYEGKNLKIISILIFAMTFIFNYGFEPFHVDYNEHKMSYYWVSMMHSIIPVLVLLTLASLVKMLQLNLKWKLTKETTFLFCFLILTGIFQFLIRDLIYNNENNWSIQYLIEEIRNTLLAGSLFCVILIPYHRNRLVSESSLPAYYINNKTINTKQPQTAEIKKVQIHDFELDIDQFLFAKAEGNYVEVYLNNELHSKALIRMTLKDFESGLKSYPYIIKTHRSYIINSQHVKKVVGNAQGYQLHIQQHIVPVSRNNMEIFNNKINRMTNT